MGERNLMGMKLDPVTLEKALALAIKTERRATPEPGRFVMTIEKYQPVMLNQMMGKHPMKIHRLKQIDKDTIAAEAVRQQIPKAYYKRRVLLRVILSPSQKRMPDPDAFDKSLLDALVSCGLLVDDSKKWLEMPEPEYERGKDKATIITLEDIP